MAKQQKVVKSSRKSTNSYDVANFISRIYCLYVFSFLYRFYRKNFGFDVIDPAPRQDQCDRLSDSLRRNWNLEVTHKKAGHSASLCRALGKSFGCQFLFQNVKNFICTGLLRMSMPLLLGRIIHYANRYFEQSIETETLLVADGPEGPNWLTPWIELTSKQYVLLYSFLLGAVILLNLCISHPYYMCEYRYGMNVRVAVSRLVYEKALRATSQTVQRITGGKIVNLISNDVNRFDIAYIYSCYCYMAIIETGIAMWLLSSYIGMACLGTLAITVVYIPFQTVMANVLSRFRSASITLTDDRLRLMAQLLPAMRVIKMYVWEQPFARLVHMARRLEITKIRHSMILRSLNLGLYFISAKVMSFLCIILFLVNGGTLNAEIVFVTLSLVALIRELITLLFPTGISTTVEMYISIKRIESFLLEEEISSFKSIQTGVGISTSEANSAAKISFDRVTVHSELNQASSVTILKDISFEVVPGKLTIIIGPVGSGKSSVLLSALNELPISSPDGTGLQTTGKLIYTSQEAWIFNGTVRDNILFGKEYDAERYQEVVKVVAMSKDLQMFEQGDQTVVDDRGTSLSGGQRARLSLARALYADADCYLLDDPLSAVDTSVAKHIFERAVKEYLRAKCVILVTHQLQFIKQADQIVVLKDGGMLACGSYLDLLNQGIDVFKYSTTGAEQLNASDCVFIGSTESSLLGSQYVSGSFSAKQSYHHRLRDNSFNSDALSVLSRTNSYIESDSDAADQMSILDYARDVPTQAQPAPSQDGIDQSNQRMHSTECGSSTGNSGSNSKLKIYWLYIRSGAGLLLFTIFLSTNLVTQFLYTGSDYWLSAWTDHQEKTHLQATNVSLHEFDRNPIVAEEEMDNILIYSGIVLGLFVFSIVRTVSYFVICMRSSVRLHNRIFSSLIRAPIVFFDRTPIGTIMNRVSRDLAIIDDLLPPAAFEAIDILGSSFGVFLMSALVNYLIIPPFIVLMVMIYFASRFYVNTARRLKRLEGVARSPLFSQLAATLNGLTTIRSYGVESMFIERFSAAQDQHTGIFFTYISAQRLYGIFLESICVLYVYSLLIVMNLSLDSYTGSTIGLIISQSLTLTNWFNWGIRQYTDVESYMTSVERVAEFGQLDKEELTKGTVEPPEDWPSSGDITYEGVSLFYRQNGANEQTAVLQDLNFQIGGGDKIGIVGRTGAGKSSLITTLFRLSQPVGSIRIDGLDTGDVPLARLRRGLSIIPQEPILFSGTIRHNLDPFGEKSDLELWDAIDKVQLKSKILSFPAKLDSLLSEGGADFSVGQKQLLCLARAILRKNRILILDEATANVDPRTDSLIQQTIRAEFSTCTVLTIAHRLNTIIDYDQVMVLDAGRLEQFGTPFELIRQKEGIFYGLYRNLNKDTKKELKKMAKRAFEERIHGSHNLSK